PASCQLPVAGCPSLLPGNGQRATGHFPFCLRPRFLQRSPAMSEDFGTVNVRPSARSREIEMIRQHYRAHRDTLGRLAAEAPTEHLAAEYIRLMADIDTSLRKLDELEGRAAATPAAAPPPSSPGSRPLVMTPGEPAPAVDRYATSPGAGTSSSSRVILIVLIGLVVLGALTWLIWRASSQRPPSAQSTTTPPGAP